MVRTQFREYQDDPGILRSFKRIAVDYQSEVKDLGALERKAYVPERGIISQSEKTKVALSEVKPGAVGENATSRLVKTPGIWEWHVRVGPEESQKITYTATGEMPAELMAPALGNL